MKYAQKTHRSMRVPDIWFHWLHLNVMLNEFSGVFASSHFTFHNFFFIRSPSWPGTHMETRCTHVHSHKCKRIEKLTDILQQKPFSMYVQFVCMLAFATRHETWTGVSRYRENYLNIFFKFAQIHLWTNIYFNIFVIRQPN